MDKSKLLLITIILIFVVNPIFSNSGTLAIGFIGQRSIPLNSESFNPTINDFQVGAQLRLKVLFVEAIASTLYDSVGEKFDFFSSVGIRTSLFNIIHFGLGFGPSFSVGLKEKSPYFYREGLNENYVETETFSDAFKKGLFYYLGHLDVKVKNGSAGFMWSIPSKGFSLDSSNSSLFLPNWAKIRLGVSLMYYLF